MKRISKKTREEAILLADVLASEQFDEPIHLVVDALGVGLAAWTLYAKVANWIYDSVYGGDWGHFGEWIDAEAAQLLREGWTP